MATPSTLSLLHARIGALPIPPHDDQEFTYIAAGAADDDDIQTIKYYRGGLASGGGVLVATVTMTYFGSTNNVKTITLSVP